MVITTSLRDDIQMDINFYEALKRDITFGYSYHILFKHSTETTKNILTSYGEGNLYKEDLENILQMLQMMREEE